MNQKSNHICPLCGDRNECALAQTGNISAKCWCQDVTISPAAIALLQKLPNNESYICKRCATATKTNLENPQINAKLYSSEFCHLCEEAAEVIRKAGITITITDILDDDGLFE